MQAAKKIIIIFTGIFMIMSCSRVKYNGYLDFKKYSYLKDIKIFVDAGHGGLGDTDMFRTGPGGLTEEQVNLKVALILREMLKTAGAEVIMSREKDTRVELRDRVAMVEDAQPDLLVSIHHNGSPRRVDGVNYPCALIWGTVKVSPLSYNLARMLQEEFQRITDKKGHVLSDFAVYSETGTMILRETRNICPGVIGECGFFSDEGYEKMLADVQYNQIEAEAYFTAIARFVERGIPKAEALISIKTPANVTEEKPVIAIRALGGNCLGVNKKSFNAWFDGFPVKCIKESDNLFFIDFGKKLYPGGHTVKFKFENERGQSSMIYSAGFVSEIKKGDYDKLGKEGIKKISSGIDIKEGIKMLLSALSMGLTDPESADLLWNIAQGYSKIGDKNNADYFYAKLYNFYPESKYNKKLKHKFTGFRFPAEQKGKPIPFVYEPLLDQSENGCKKY